MGPSGLNSLHPDPPQSFWKKRLLIGYSLSLNRNLTKQARWSKLLTMVKGNVLNVQTKKQAACMLGWVFRVILNRHNKSHLFLLNLLIIQCAGRKRHFSACFAEGQTVKILDYEQTSDPRENMKYLDQLSGFFYVGFLDMYLCAYGIAQVLKQQKSLKKFPKNWIRSSGNNQTFISTKQV